MSNSGAFVWSAVPSVKYALRFPHVCWGIIKGLCLSFGAVLAGGMNNSSGYCGLACILFHFCFNKK